MIDGITYLAIAQGVSIGAVFTVGLGALVALICVGIRVFKGFLD